MIKYIQISLKSDHKQVSSGHFKVTQEFKILAALLKICLAFFIALPVSISMNLFVIFSTALSLKRVFKFIQQTILVK